MAELFERNRPSKANAIHDYHGRPHGGGSNVALWRPHILCTHLPFGLIGQKVHDTSQHIVIQAHLGRASHWLHIDIQVTVQDGVRKTSAQWVAARQKELKEGFVHQRGGGSWESGPLWGSGPDPRLGSRALGSVRNLRWERGCAGLEGGAYITVEYFDAKCKKRFVLYKTFRS